MAWMMPPNPPMAPVHWWHGEESSDHAAADIAARALATVAAAAVDRHLDRVTFFTESRPLIRAIYGDPKQARTLRIYGARLTQWLSIIPGVALVYTTPNINAFSHRYLVSPPARFVDGFPGAPPLSWRWITHDHWAHRSTRAT